MGVINLRFLFACKAKVLVGMFTGCIAVVGHVLTHDAERFHSMVYCNRSLHENNWNWSIYSLKDVEIIKEGECK